MQLGTKRDGRLLSQVEAIKPRVWKARTWTHFSVHTPEANRNVLLGFSPAHLSSESLLRSSERVEAASTTALATLGIGNPQSQRETVTVLL